MSKRKIPEHIKFDGRTLSRTDREDALKQCYEFIGSVGEELNKMNRYLLCERAGLKVFVNWHHMDAIHAADVEKLLEGAPVVYGVFDNGKPCCWSYVCDTEGSKDTHAARLIMIEPIKPKSLEDKISEILDDHSKSATESLTAIRRLLEGK